ncbi:S1C family serine protease [Scleromatobacter humisilvae]|uniref:Trypsin-like peptidase domain-containing protein n=1 Tax=Scleromatobacter humisilvae TaxID=2897159 RepID=A0A9X2C0Q6_9BURK|nr:trypsin-like peptidase domain-containing protein [Scleromatobacter humisilvae]MCK9684964.1 trypsin-like peptidase domain-containing protein [Scleromatobacter humisilvae]
MISIRILAAVAAACGICATATAQSNDTAFPEANAPSSPAGAAPPKFEFARIRSRIAIGEKFGWVETGMFCTGRTDLRANAKIEDIANNEANAAFKAAIRELGLRSAAPEISSFDTAPAKSDPDYRIGGVLETMSLQECHTSTERKGDFAITVKWEVFSPRLQKVVYSQVTSGSAHIDSFEAVTGGEFEARAYLKALREMMKDPGFVALKAADGPAVATVGATVAAPALAPLHLKSAAAMAGGTQANAPALRNAVATVLRDNVSGSAFYVADGYLLTNHHVVGNAHYVKVKLSGGRIIVGEVVRDDARRDVALIKTEPAGVPVLHVSMGDPAVGSDVFAIGSPLGQELAGTFTRGVLSGNREVNGLEYLQSDVAINPGNSGGPLLDGTSTVVGMAVLKITQASGLSFFIPMRDVANTLQLIFD